MNLARIVLVTKALTPCMLSQHAFPEAEGRIGEFMTQSSLEHHDVRPQ